MKNVKNKPFSFLNLKLKIKNYFKKHFEQKELRKYNTFIELKSDNFFAFDVRRTQS